MRFQNNTQNCEGRKIYPGMISPILPSPPILNSSGLLGGDCIGRARRLLISLWTETNVGSIVTHPSRSRCPIAPSKNSQRTSPRLPLWCLTMLGSSRDLGSSRRCRQTGGSTAIRDMTYLTEPQFAAGVSALVPDHRAHQPRLAGMGASLSQMTFGSINLSLSNCARRLLVHFWALA